MVHCSVSQVRITIIVILYTLLLSIGIGSEALCITKHSRVKGITGSRMRCIAPARLYHNVRVRANLH